MWRAALLNFLVLLQVLLMLLRMMLRMAMVVRDRLTPSSGTVDLHLECWERDARECMELACISSKVVQQFEREKADLLQQGPASTSGSA